MPKQSMQVPLLDLKQQYQTIKEEVLKETEALFATQYFILGPRVEKLEDEIAAYCQAPHALGVSSGTDALIISLMAAEIGPGDHVITTPYTFFATAGSIVRIGATPVFVDVDPVTYNISIPGIKEVFAKMDASQRKTVKAIIPVHLYGQCADMDPLLDFAQEHQMTVIEDAAQAIGSEYKGRRAGSMGDYGCFSFFPSKNLGAFGDGGIVTTSTQENYDKLVKLRNHGAHPKYYHQLIGGNFRLDALQAMVVSIKLKYLDQWILARQQNAQIYRDLFAEAAITGVKLPEAIETRHIYNQFIIEVPTKRDALRSFLNGAGVGHEVYYPVPLHLQECFAYLGYQKGDCPVSEAAAEHTLALPIYPELNREQQEYVVSMIKQFYA